MATLLQRVDLSDRISIEAGEKLQIRGFLEDTLVRDALVALADEVGIEPNWNVNIEKKIPVAAGLGGGSSDAASALRLANETLTEPLLPEALNEMAAGIGADVPFFLAAGPQLGIGDGSELTPVELPQDYWVVLVLPAGAEKPSTAEVYAAFDGAAGFERRKSELLDLLAGLQRPSKLADLPPNDLASSPVADELQELGAFRADVSGAGPAVYGLFVRRDQAEAAHTALASRGRTWLTVPAWYG